MSRYEDRIWCDVLDIDAAHILLGRPWLYYLDVTSLIGLTLVKLNSKRRTLCWKMPSPSWCGE